MTNRRLSDFLDINVKAVPFVPLTETRAQLGESPVWSHAHNAIWWVDIIGRKLLCTELTGATQIWPTPEIPGFVQCLGEEVLVGMQSGIFRFDPTTAQFEKRVTLLAPNQRFNDACTDTQGRIWAGTMDIDNQQANGTLYLFDPTYRTLVSKFEGFRTINGLAWDLANGRLFLSDSHHDVQTVWTCKVDLNGRVSERTVFARFDDLDGRPDGAALDAEGRYWIAGVGGGALYRFAPNGASVTKYDVPVKSPTKPAFVDTSPEAMILTSFEDEMDGGRLGIWHNPVQE